MSQECSCEGHWRTGCGAQKETFKSNDAYYDINYYISHLGKRRTKENAHCSKLVKRKETKGHAQTAWEFSAACGAANDH
jgi:hypothetical protein